MYDYYKKSPTALLLKLFLGLILTVTPALGDVGIRAGQLVDEADVTYVTRFTWSCSPSTWDRILSNPLLMGALWKAYGFAPAYDITARGDTLHVEDPTGLIGDAFRLHRNTGEVAYLVDGRLNHWAVPFFNEASAVFILKSHFAQGKVVANLQVYLRAGSTVGSLVLQAAKPLLAKHVDNRVTLNLQDVRKIVEEIDTSPARVASRLSGKSLEQFKHIFQE